MLQFAPFPLAELGRLKATHSHVMLALLGFADRDGVCWPSLRTLAEVCGQPRSVVSRAIKEMVSLGYLVVERTRKHRSNLYRIATRFLVRSPAARRQCPASGPTVSRQRDDDCPASGTEVDTDEREPRKRFRARAREPVGDPPAPPDARATESSSHQEEGGTTPGGARRATHPFELGDGRMTIEPAEPPASSGEGRYERQRFARGRRVDVFQARAAVALKVADWYREQDRLSGRGRAAAAA